MLKNVKIKLIFSNPPKSKELVSITLQKNKEYFNQYSMTVNSRKCAQLLSKNTSIKCIYLPLPYLHYFCLLSQETKSKDYNFKNTCNSIKLNHFEPTASIIRAITKSTYQKATYCTLSNNFTFNVFLQFYS